jgi:hypothetical protein
MCNSNHHWIIDTNGNATCKHCGQSKHFQTNDEYNESCDHAKLINLSFIDRKSYLSIPVIGGKHRDIGIMG